MPIGQIDIPGMPPGQMINLGEMMKGMIGSRPQQKRTHDGGGGAARCWSARKPTSCSTTTG